MSKDPSSREPGLPFIQGTTDLETGLYLVIDQENMTPSSFKSDFVLGSGVFHLNNSGKTIGDCKIIFIL